MSLPETVPIQPESLPAQEGRDANLSTEIVADHIDSAWRIYDAELKHILEPASLGSVVAIDLVSHSYEVAKRSSTAWRTLKQRQPDAVVVVIDIGPISSLDPLERHYAAPTVTQGFNS